MAKEATDLSKQRTFESNFQSWFDSGLRPILEDNRRRYRMQLADEDERKKRGLSCLPSTKSTAVVDRAVEKALLEYHGEPDAITFTAKGITDHDRGMKSEQMARLLTEIFHYRSKRTGFPFFTWHASSLTASFADGMEAAMVYWRKESYKKKRKVYHFQPDPMAEMEEVDEDVYKMGVKTMPDFFHEMEVEDEHVVRDTWWIDSLKPGEDVLWDFKAPLLNINLGEACLVKLYRTKGEIEKLAEQGIFDRFDKKKLNDQAHFRTHPEKNDNTATVTNPEAFSLSAMDRAEVWAFFEKEDCQWWVTFSIEGKVELSSRRNVNDVFFGGRPVNLLPVVIGTCKLKLWENIGRGLPETIAPIEDDLTEHRNAVADATKIAIQGRYRVGRASDVSYDDLLNNRVVVADPGEFERMDDRTTQNILNSLRAADAVERDIAELVPIGMENRNLVPRGTARTATAVQLALSGQNEKQSVNLIVRNQTFFEPLLYLIAQLEFAYETDDVIARFAGTKAQVEVPQTVVGGQLAVDWSQFDFDAEVQINAGLGSIPRQQKAEVLTAITEWRMAHGIPTDVAKIAAQLNVLAGYAEGAFDLPPEQQPPPPGPKMTANLNVDLSLFDPQTRMQLIQQFMQGSENISASVTQNAPVDMMGGMVEGGGMPMPDGGPSPGGIEPGGQGGYDLG